MVILTKCCKVELGKVKQLTKFGSVYALKVVEYMCIHIQDEP